MRKLTRKSLDELAQRMPVLSEEVQSSFVGGGDGSFNDPYTFEEYSKLHNPTQVFYLNDSGTICYDLPDVVVVGQSGSVSGSVPWSISGNASDPNTGSGIYYSWGNLGGDYGNEAFWSWFFGGGGSDGTTLPYFDGTENFTDDLSIVGDSMKENAGKTRFGSDGKFRFETQTGRVFNGNQYVTTTSLKEIGNVIGKYAGKAAFGVTVYNVVATGINEGHQHGVVAGFEAAGKEGAKAAGGYAGASAGIAAGGKVGALVGTAICPGAGTIAGIIAGIILGVGGSLAGEYLVEITLK